MELEALVRRLAGDNNHIRVTVELNPRDLPSGPHPAENSKHHKVETPAGTAYVGSVGDDGKSHEAKIRLMTDFGLDESEAVKFRNRPLDYIRDCIAYIEAKGKKGNRPGYLWKMLRHGKPVPKY